MMVRQQLETSAIASWMETLEIRLSWPIVMSHLAGGGEAEDVDEEKGQRVKEETARWE